MGQRTQIILIRESRNGTRKINVMHFQNGIDDRMLLAFTSIITAHELAPWYYKDYNFNDGDGINDTFGSRAFDITTEFEPELLSSIDPDDITTVQAVFNRCDNNNGGMVIHAKETYDKENYHHEVSYRIAFLLGWEQTDEDKKPFSEYIDAEQYMQAIHGDSYDAFVYAFEQFCAHFNVNYIQNS